ncbi:type II toxin-antitoxin system VapC family toxin [Methanosphaera sp. ISO3-F5]|uniref:type II toxin-antitoxin system VapC family toxin n=1 Tax=Methanosphaera sp. ISO3-F5 TaxID=1452353 RepID=UPI002B261762|nr:type II toxin-antitoxin system VapC family toxin [Methanosphaera sp. ISO3-F5]WQH64169.1 type II toxin-antitoxin system VapC family toxin [Methanosphaera sp. ISO3-F5]
MIFLDSCFLISLISDKSSKHDDAIELLNYVDNEHKVINSLVLSETLNGIHRCEKRKSLEEIYDIMRETADIIYLKQKDYLEAISLSKHYNNAINYSDFIILKTMQDKKINKIVSFDGGFDKIKGINRIY